MNKSVLYLLSALWIPAAAHAEGPIQVDVSASWKHAETGVVLPPAIGPFERNRVVDSTSSQSDVSADYDDKATGTHVTVYLFRAGLPDVAVWQHRVGKVIANYSERYGQIDQANLITAIFTPKSGGVDSASRIVYPLSGTSFRSTGSAMLAVDGWLVSIRMTSTALDAGKLDASLAALVDGIDVPIAKKAAPSVYTVEDCNRPAPDKKARRAEDSMSSAIFGGLLSSLSGSLTDDSETDESLVSQPESEHFCLLASGGPGYDVIAKPSEVDRYVIAFGDAGAIIDIGKDGLIAAIEKRTEYSMRMVDSELASSFRGFKSLPSVSQVIDVLSSERPVSSVHRTPGADKQINIHTPGK